MDTISKIGSVIVIVAILGLGIFALTQKEAPKEIQEVPQIMEEEDGFGGANPNMQARLLSNATTTVGNQSDITIFSEKQYCASRVVSTIGTPIMLSFKSSTLNPSATRGHIQGASTTVAYDSALYGCGAIVAAASASTTISVAEFIY